MNAVDLEIYIDRLCTLTLLENWADELVLDNPSSDSVQEIAGIIDGVRDFLSVV